MQASIFLRETALGQLIRLLTNNKLLQYPEEKPDFVVPAKYLGQLDDGIKDKGAASSDKDSKEESGAATTAANNNNDGKMESDLEAAKGSAQLKDSQAVALQLSKTNDYITVEWYSDLDPENPQNWKSLAKHTILLSLFVATFAVYGGSSIITLGYDSLIAEFNLTIQQATLCLSMYVLGYGTGAMVWSPLSEIPAIGRNTFYWGSMLIFVCLQVGAPLTHNYSGLIAIRFFTGFMGSPTLSIAGASLQDVYNPMYIPVVFSVWTVAAFFGPSIGPLVAGFAVEAHNWRWSMWELLWMAGFAEILLILIMPETSHPNILLKRARRLRKLTGNDKIRSLGELEQASLTASNVFLNAIVRPTQIIFLDPQIMFADLYIALLYSAYYLFFAAFPQWQLGLGWSIAIQGISYLSIVIGGIIGMIIYVLYQILYMPKYYQTKGWPAAEKRLEPALLASFILPIGLFIFAWTAKRQFTWVAALIGVALVTGANFIIFQCILFYIALTYPKYAASILAGNDFIRSSFAAALVHAGPPMYTSLTVAGGSSLIAGLTIVFILPLLLIYLYGEKLRGRSRFTS